MTDDMTEEFDDEALVEVLAALGRSFQDSDEREFESVYDFYFPSRSNSSSVTIPTPREFNSAFSKDSRLKNALAREVASNLGVPEKNAWRVVYIYENFSFIKPFISSLVSKFEGGACSVDKTSWLLSYYVKTQKADEVGNILPISEQKWNTPRVDTIPLWVAVLDELPYFKSGKYEKLFAFLRLLENHYVPDQGK